VVAHALEIPVDAVEDLLGGGQVSGGLEHEDRSSAARMVWSLR